MSTILLALAAAASAQTPPPETLKARVVVWDLAFKPRTQAEWIARLKSELDGALASGADVVVFPELLAWGLAPYLPKERPAEQITRVWLKKVLPAFESSFKGKDVLIVLGSYPHQEKGWTHAFNRATVWHEGKWSFADKLDPTQPEEREDPPIKPGLVLPLYSFKGGTAAVLICYSVEKPEVAARLKAAGVQLVLVPSATLDEHGVGRIRRTATARAVELGAAVLVSPLVGAIPDWPNMGGAGLYLPDQEGVEASVQEGPVLKEGIKAVDFAIPWARLLAMRNQAPKPETRPFLSPTVSFSLERRGGMP